MPHVDVLDATVVVKGVEYLQEGGADDPEDVAHLLGLQELDHRAPAGQRVHLRLLLARSGAL
jgi:hypothetical protein